MMLNKNGKLVCVLLMLSVTTGLAPTPSGPELTGRVVSVSSGDSLSILTPAYEQVQIRLVGLDAPEPSQPWSKKSRDLLLCLTIGKNVRVVPYGKDAWGRVLGDVYFGSLSINKAVVERGGAWAYASDEEDPPIVPEFSQDEVRARQLLAGLWAMSADQTVAPRDYRRRRAEFGEPQAPEPINVTATLTAALPRIASASGQAVSPRSVAKVAPITRQASPRVTSPVTKSRANQVVSRSPRTQSASSSSSRAGKTRPRSSSRRSTSSVRYTSAPVSRPSSSGRCGAKRYCTQMNSCREAYFFMNSCGLYRLDGDGDGVPCESLCG
jgi:endonuclease YncB( thermonuclease family)